jgi:hypothetical protein
MGCLDPRTLHVLILVSKTSSLQVVHTLHTSTFYLYTQISIMATVVHRPDCNGKYKVHPAFTFVDSVKVSNSDCFKLYASRRLLVGT